MNSSALSVLVFALFKRVSFCMSETMHVAIFSWSSESTSFREMRNCGFVQYFASFHYIFRQFFIDRVVLINLFLVLITRIWLTTTTSTYARSPRIMVNGALPFYVRILLIKLEFTTFIFLKYNIWDNYRHVYIIFF
jgi:hypothetical protein